MAENDLDASSIIALADDMTEVQVNQTAQFLANLPVLRSRTSGELPPTLVFSKLRTLIFPAPSDVLRSLRLVGNFGIVAIDKERLSFAPPGPEPSVDPQSAGVRSRGERVINPLDVTGVLKSKATGEGQLIMVLDIGFYAQHPDFKNRKSPITFHSFTGTPVLDASHGTRTLGLTCGPFQPAQGKRYGVAHKAEAFAGVVRQTTGIPDRFVLEGLEEAIKLQAAVVNLSFGATIDVAEPYNTAFEMVAQRTLQNGVVVVAAAGNDPPNADFPVNHPGNCPSVLAVGALDGNLRALPESCVRRNCDGEVDIAAPGFRIRSSTVPFDYYEVRSGTSSAAAIVSGIAALWAQRGYRGCDLWHALVDNARGISGGSRRTTGAGIVRAPK